MLIGGWGWCAVVVSASIESTNTLSYDQLLSRISHTRRYGVNECSAPEWDRSIWKHESEPIFDSSSWQSMSTDLSSLMTWPWDTRFGGLSQGLMERLSKTVFSHDLRFQHATCGQICIINTVLLYLQQQRPRIWVSWLHTGPIQPYQFAILCCSSHGLAQIWQTQSNVHLQVLHYLIILIWTHWSSLLGDGGGGLGAGASFGSTLAVLVHISLLRPWLAGRGGGGECM